MLSSRVVIFSQDGAAAKSWVGAVAATGSTVDVVSDVAQVDIRSDLVVAELSSDSESLVGKLKALGPTSSAVVIVPSPDLVGSIKQLQIPSVRAVLVKDYINQSLLTGVAARLLRGNIFGISKALPWGTRIYSEIVGSHDDRLQALATLSRFTAGLKLRAKYREAIDVVADELLMNGLYDAPIDAQGKAVFGEVAPGQRTDVRLERPAVLQFATDGSRLALAVRDSFGSLERESVLNNLARCAASGDQIDRKTAGAGLGLYLVANHVSELVFNILPGVATEVSCVVDLKVPKQQLQHLAFYEEQVQGAEKSDGRESGQLRGAGRAAAPAPASNAAVHLTLIVALLLLVVAGLLMAWPYIHKPPKGAINVITEPPGATVRVNGVRKGVANPSVEIKDLDTKTPCNVTATLEGYAEAQEVVKPKRDQTLDVKLQLRRMKAKLRISSAPEGAQVWINGKDTGQKTPTVLEDLEPESPLEVVMKKHGFASSTGTVKPLGSQTLIYHAKLSLAGGFAMIGLTSKPAGARLLINDVDTGEVTPIPGFVVRGAQRYVLKLALEGRVPWVHVWTARVGSRLVKAVDLPEGGRLTLTTNTPGVALIGDSRHRLPLRNRLVPAGDLSVRLRSTMPLLDHVVKLTIGPGQTLTRQITFGFVKVEPKKWRIKIAGNRPASKMALKPGSHEITLVDRKGASRRTTVEIVARKTVTVDAAKLDGSGSSARKPRRSKRAAPKRAAPKRPAPKRPAPKKPAPKKPTPKKPAAPAPAPAPAPGP